MAGTRDLLYLFGIAGHPAPSPVLAQLEAAGFNVVVPRIKGFDASWDFVAPALGMSSKGFRVSSKP